METTQKLIQVFRDFGEINIVHILFIIVAAWLILLVSLKLLPRIARKLSGKFRIHVLALVPAIRRLVMIGAAVLIFRRLAKPTMENLVILFGFLGVGLGFALKITPAVCWQEWCRCIRILTASVIGLQSTGYTGK